MMLLWILLALILAYVLYVAFGSRLPSDINQLIHQVDQNPLPELITGQKGIATSNGVSIVFESIHPENASKGSVFFINGLTYSMLDWPQYFIDSFVEEGYHVIRFDNRDVGTSERIKNWDKRNPYTLKDMANDALSVLDANGIKKVHLVGASMGGMISQIVAISNPERVLTLTSIMSTGFTMDPELVSLPKPFLFDAITTNLRYGFRKNKTNVVRILLENQYRLKGKDPYEIDYQKMIEKYLYELKNRKGYNLAALFQQSAAIKASGSRYEALQKLTIPTLVIHGTDDPLVKIEHAFKYAPMIPNVSTLIVEGMGHDLPEIYNLQITEAIIKHIKAHSN